VTKFLEPKNNMKIGPKYKIARRLGAPVFEKTQTQKYTLSQARKANARSTKKHMSQVTDYGVQMKEKQKARYTYLLSEKQFSNYVKRVLESQNKNKSDFLFSILESRLDSAIFRIGFASTRSAARQFVSHGHITIDGRKMTIPSYNVKMGEKIGIRIGSQKKGLFKTLDERLKDITLPNWMKFDNEKKEAVFLSAPSLEKMSNVLYDLDVVLEFYSR